MSISQNSARGVKLGVITAVLVAAEAVAILETTMSTQLLYAPEGFFDVSVASLTWILTAYTLAAAISAAIAARLGDIFGRRNVLAGVLFLSAFGSLISAFAPEFWILIAGRALQGVSGAALPLAIGYISAIYPRERVGTAVTVVSSSAVIAGAFGVLLGGVILSALDWHAIYWITAIAAAACAALVYYLLPNEAKETLVTGRRIDVLGAVLFGVGIASVLFATTNSVGVGLFSPMVLIPGISGLVLLVIFVLWELKITSPLFDLAILKIRNVRNAMIMSVFLGFGPLGMYQALSPRLHRQPAEVGDVVVGVGLGMHPVTFGIVTGVAATLAFLLSGVIGRLSDRYGAWFILVLGCGLATIGLTMNLVGPSSVFFVVGGMTIFTISSACLMSGIPSLIVQTVDSSIASVTAAMAQNIRNVFQSVGTAVLGVLLSIGAVTVGNESLVSYSGLMAGATAIIVAAFIVVLLALRSKRSVGEPDQTVTEVAMSSPDHAQSRS